MSIGTNPERNHFKRKCTGVHREDGKANPEPNHFKRKCTGVHREDSKANPEPNHFKRKCTGVHREDGKEKTGKTLSNEHTYRDSHMSGEFIVKHLNDISERNRKKKMAKTF